MKVDGRCHCGRITYEATVDPATSSVCHCTDCQMLTGSAYRVAVLAPLDGFRLVSGEPKRYIKTADNGNQLVQAFCGDCGSPVYSLRLEHARGYWLRVGCLRERAVLQPLEQVWCRSEMSWSASLEGVPRSMEE